MSDLSINYQHTGGLSISLDDLCRKFKQYSRQTIKDILNTHNVKCFCNLPGWETYSTIAVQHLQEDTHVSTNT